MVERQALWRRVIGAKYGCEGEVGALFPLLALMV